MIAGIISPLSRPYLISGLAISLVIIGIFIAKEFLFPLSQRVETALSLVMFLGAGYYFIFDHSQADLKIIFDQKVEFTGTITAAEQRINSQVLRLDNIQIVTSRYPEFEYGDRIKAVGVVKKPAGDFANYYKKESVAGIISFPKIKVLSRAKVPSVKGALFKIKAFFETSYKRVLPFEQAAFLSGLTLGSTAEFNDEFKEKMRLTGTTHLVALSGYNISVLTRSVGFVLAGWWLTKKLRLPISILFVLGFVVMTGAEPSVVRAAIMAMILLLADQISRIAYIPNVIAATALAMVLINPKILAFDVGFQLSFMALLGLIYVEPWLRKKLKAKEEPGILNWRSHFWTTTSAQLAVLPIIIYHFGFVSPVSILTNVLLLEFIPVTMGLGFFVGFAAIVSHWLSWIIAFPTQAFLGYELTIIDVFSKIMNIF